MIFQWLRRHQIAAFFLITFLISWVSWILGFVLFPEDELLQAPFYKIGIYAPTIIAILISGLINRKPFRVRAITRWGIFCVFWLAAWLHIVLYAHVTSDLIIDTKLVVIGGIIATLPAFVISSAFSSNDGIRKLLASIMRPSGNPIWYLLAILIIPATIALGGIINLALAKGLSSPDQSIQVSTSLGTIVLVFINEFLQAGGLPEEAGWRGFALPRLQAHYSPLTASIILGPIWALWHGPLLIGMLQEAGPWRLLLRILMIGIAFTWLYNKTNGSILAVMLLHASWNTALAFLPNTDTFLFLMLALLSTAVVADRMWEKLPTDSVMRYRAADDVA